MSPMQTEGVENRSTMDNVMIILAIIVTFADVQKCFDKLWLNGIMELWNCGMTVRDCIMTKNLNHVVVVKIDTPVGSTEEVTFEDIVMQGTVGGPKICGVSMDKINSTGQKITTYYGPELEIGALAFVDDLASAGTQETARSMIKSCSFMEKTKKMTLNTDPGKSAYMVVNPKGEKGIITEDVQNGPFREVQEYKYLGVWMDVTGKYNINIQKIEKKIPYMITTIKSAANTSNMGTLAASARLKLMESVVMPSILYGVEVYPNITKKEMDRLERIQGKILRTVWHATLNILHGNANGNMNLNNGSKNELQEANVILQYNEFG